MLNSSQERENVHKGFSMIKSPPLPSKIDTYYESKHGIIRQTWCGDIDARLLANSCDALLESVWEWGASQVLIDLQAGQPIFTASDFIHEANRIYGELADQVRFAHLLRENRHLAQEVLLKTISFHENLRYGIFYDETKALDWLTKN